MAGTSSHIRRADVARQADDLLDHLARILGVERDRLQECDGAGPRSAIGAGARLSPEMEAALMRMGTDVRARFRALLHELDG